MLFNALEEFLALDSDAGDPFGGGGTDPSAVLASVEARERIWRAILDLPPRQRDALVLRQLEGLPAVEVAARLGVEEPTVRAHIHAAREALRARLFDRDDRGNRADRGNGGER